MTLLANDIDSHEMIPSHLLGDVLGQPGRIMGKLFEATDKLRPDPTDTNMHQPDITGDVKPIDSDDIWKIKGPSAPSAIDMSRRVEVLDTMGIDRQLVFPTTAIAAMMVGRMNDIAFDMRFGADASVFEGLSRWDFRTSFLNAYNEWVADEPVRSDGRIRMVGIVPTSQDLGEMLRTTKDPVS